MSISIDWGTVAMALFMLLAICFSVGVLLARALYPTKPKTKTAEERQKMERVRIQTRYYK